jgi:Methyltransferase domain
MGLFSFARKSGHPKSRTDLLNHLIATKGYRRYLEIGVRDPRDNFNRVRVEDKDSVDPNPRRPVGFRMTSDAFFAGRAAARDGAPYDLIFVDGLHLADQVERDVVNGLANLAPDGAIVLHDCNPITEKAQVETYVNGEHWNGTVWKAWAKLRATRPDLSMAVVDIDEGCGVIRRGSQTLFPLPSLDYGALDYQFLAQHRREALNLIAVQEFLKTISPPSMNPGCAETQSGISRTEKRS